MKRTFFALALLALLGSACQPAAQPPTPAPTPDLPPYETPDWFRTAVVYEVFVRSFRDSDGDGIGDLNGVTEKLDYLQSLGVDTLWLMPIYPSPSVHGYDVTDFYAVNPEYGTLDDLRALVAAAHERGMRILLDFVPSHLSNQHALFAEAYGNPGSIHSDWFVFTNDANTYYATFAGNETQPRFNHYNPEVVDYLSQAALFWLDLDGDGDYSDGVDGLRVDNATFPPQEFFIELRRRVKAVDPDALLLGEGWVNTASDLSLFFEDQFDALFDFPLQQTLLDNNTSNGSGILNGRGHPLLLSSRFEEEAKYYPPQAMVVRFLGNHDTNRLYTRVGGDPNRLRLAFALLTALPGPIAIYYGEEIGMPGQKGGPPYWDNYRREPMDWYTAEAGPGQTTWFMPEDRWNRAGDGLSVEEQAGDPGSLLAYYQRLLALRASSPALRNGDFTLLDLQVSATGGWGFLRQADGQTVIALFNFSNAPVEITIPAFPFEAPALTDLLGGGSFPPAAAGGAYPLSLPAAGVVWLAIP